MAVLGVSFDDRAANAAFRGQHELPFPLLCDAGHELAIAYGAADAAARMPKRKAVLIDEKGNIAALWPQVDPRSFAESVLQALAP